MVNARAGQGLGPNGGTPTAGVTLRPSSEPTLTEITAAIHEALLKRLDGEKLHSATTDEARKLVEEAVTALLAAGEYRVFGEARQRVISMVIDEVLGLGPIQPLLEDASVSEVMVNGFDKIYCERNGVIQRTELRFRDDAHVQRIADRILAPIGRRIDESSPMVDARLKDGSRVNITIPPCTPAYSTMSIRKFRTDRQSMKDLMAAGSFDQRIGQFLTTCARYKINMLISGGTGSGKTTMLNALSAYIPAGERIVTIEDPVELALQQDHVISMEARPPDMRGQHAITQRDLLRNSLRMRPDRIIVGEIRGAEAFDMLQAMNTGHEGSLSTVHANTPRDALSRVESMVLMVGVELPMAAIREQMASALHLIVQLQRFSDGVRRIVRVSEVTGVESDKVSLQDIFIYQQGDGRMEDGRSGLFQPTGLRPTFSSLIRDQGGELPAELFTDGVI